MIYVGIGGWVYPEWRDNFYPKGLSQKRELEYASSRLTGIEINGTYYGSQKPESFRKWHDETPEGFVFALKGPRFATNRRVLAEAGESIETILRQRRHRTEGQAGAGELAVHGDQEIRSRRFRGFPRSCCRRRWTAAPSAMPWKCGMTVSRTRHSSNCAATMASPSSSAPTANFP